MVGIKPTFAPLPLCFWCKEEVESSANFQELDETWTFDRCLFEYQTELWRPADGRQIAFQTGSSVCALSSGGEAIFALRWFSRGIDVQTSRPHYCHHYIVIVTQAVLAHKVRLQCGSLYEVKVPFSQLVQGGTAATLLPRSGLKLQLGVIVFPPLSWQRR